jgi:hypothetical protein
VKRLLLALVPGLLIVAGAGIVQAEPGPNENNDHGLCTAYFNGQKNGHDKNGQPGPFQALEDASRAYTDSDGVDNDGDGQVDEDGENQDLSAAENVANKCDGLVGGNPTHGRYTCEVDSDPATAGNQPECTENPPPNER